VTVSLTVIFLGMRGDVITLLSVIFDAFLPYVIVTLVTLFNFCPLVTLYDDIARGNVISINVRL
jgi:hypothetical protein